MHLRNATEGFPIRHHNSVARIMSPPGGYKLMNPTRML
jgi:hypothetical protein